ncbi:MAG: glycine zipper 2TM domain-containing protein [Ramlibacter sp.]|nr:glycine zipper 2TM domain-containing protein [Ramlibacter sp.]
MDSTTHTSMMQPGQQPGWSERVRHSKALIPTVAVLGVTTLALAATLVSQRIGAQDGVPQDQAEVKLAPASKAPVKATPLAPQRHAAATPVCKTCGVVESVAAIQHQGQVNGIGNSGIGVGAVAGGLVGGLLGNQVGGGSGKTAATVLGAAGGAYAGHAIEKNSKKYTTYQMRVRMADGSYRTIEQPSAIAAGTSVRVEGNTLRVAPVSTSALPPAVRLG